MWELSTQVGPDHNVSAYTKKLMFELKSNKSNNEECNTQWRDRIMSRLKKKSQTARKVFK